MVIFENIPFPLTVVYLKVAGEKEPVSMPFVEALGILTNVSFDYRTSRKKSKETGSEFFVISGNTQEANNKTYEVSKHALIERLQMDIYEDKQKISDLVIQPQDEMITREVLQFLE
jgi:hypothetical protein